MIARPIRHGLTWGLAALGLANAAGMLRGAAPAPATAPAAKTATAAKGVLPPGVRAERRFGDPPAANEVADLRREPFADGKFSLRDGDVVIFAGQTNMVRQQDVGELEARLATVFADAKPRFRSMAWEGDTVYQQWRDLNFGGWRDQLLWSDATVVVAWFGQTEALDGVDRLDAFTEAYGKLINEWSAVTRRIVLITPLPFEPPRRSTFVPDAKLPDLSSRAQSCEQYAKAIRKLAESRRLLCVDPLVEGHSVSLTTDGLHLTREGQMAVGREIALRLTKSVSAPAPTESTLTPLREAVARKNQLWFDNWRPMNWAFAYGDRTQVPFGQAVGDHPPLRVEFEQFKPLVRNADQTIHELAASAAGK